MNEKKLRKNGNHSIARVLDFKFLRILAIDEIFSNQTTSKLHLIGSFYGVSKRKTEKMYEEYVSTSLHISILR